MSFILSKFRSHFTYLIVCLHLCLVCCSPGLSSHLTAFKNSLFAAEKCCATGEHLIRVPKFGLQCTPTDFTPYEVISTNISSFSESGQCDSNLNCVDVIQDYKYDTYSLVRVSGRYSLCTENAIETKFSPFPKCCPRNLIYDPELHKCTELQSEAKRSPDISDGFLQVRKTMLSTCPTHDYAIVDFESPFEIKDEKLYLEELRETFNYGDYCLESKNDFSGPSIVRVCMKREDACRRNKRRCLWKCCPDGEIYVAQNKTKVCMPRTNAGINLTAIPDSMIANKGDHKFGIISAKLNMGYVQYRNNPRTGLKIKKNGDVDLKVNYAMRDYDVLRMTYCIEHYENRTSTHQFIYVFHQDDDNNTVAIFKGIVSFISVFFASLTFICYAILPEIRNVYGKCIMMECLTLILGSFLLGYQVLFPSWAQQFCTTIGYGIIFAFLGFFAWLNVICVDMWLTFGVVKGFKVRDKKSELRKFLVYCAYGFGFPTIMITFMLIAQTTKFLPEEFTPQIGSLRCYFDYETSLNHITYFLIPMSIMQIINVILFVKTIIYCIRVKNEMQMMRDGSRNEKSNRINSFKADKDKLILLLKLFLIMGIPWWFEVLSSFVSFKGIWILSIIEIVLDTINCAKGVTIFVVFILKQNVLNLLSLKFGFKKPAPRRSTELTSLTLTSNTA